MTYSGVLNEDKRFTRDLKALSKNFHNDLKKVMRRGIQVFVRETVYGLIQWVDDYPPYVDTGKTISSMLPLARENSPLQINQAAVIKNGKTIVRMRAREVSSLMKEAVNSARSEFPTVFAPKPRPRAQNARQHQLDGEREGEQGYNIRVGTPENHDFAFVFEVQVYQWTVHSLLLGAVDRGRIAANNQMEEDFRLLRKTRRYINATR